MTMTGRKEDHLLWRSTKRAEIASVFFHEFKKKSTSKMVYLQGEKYVGQSRNLLVSKNLVRVHQPTCLVS